MNLGLLHLPWGHRHGPHAGTNAASMSYSEAVAPLDVQRRVGFVMVSTLDQDARRMRGHGDDSGTITAGGKPGENPGGS